MSTRRSWALALLLLLQGGLAAALELPPPQSRPVNDFAHVLDASTLDRLNAKAVAAVQGTTQQIAVAVFKSLDGESLEDFSIRLAERWKIGGKKNNDGVLVTIFLDDHKLRIEVGYGLEERLPDARCAQIIRDLMAPRLRRNDLAGAIETAIDALGYPVRNEPTPANLSGKAEGDDQPPPWVIILIIVVGIVFLIITRGGGGFFMGGGGFTSSGSSWSSGSSGWSGGGGSFGGGGASGSW